MSTKAHEYRAKVAECDRQAKRARKPVVRQRYTDAASLLRMLADYVDPKTHARFIRPAA